MTLIARRRGTSARRRSMPPAAATLSFRDAFGDTTSNGWGPADKGGTWTPWALPERFSTTGGVGRMALNAAGDDIGIDLASVASRDTDTTIRVRTDKLAAGGTQAFAIWHRVQANGDGYAVRMALAVGGAVTLTLLKWQGSETVLVAATTVSGLTHTANGWINVRFRTMKANATTLQAKAWADGAAPPANWTVSTTDSSAGLQQAGYVALNGILAAGATNAPVLMDVDDVSGNYFTTTLGNQFYHDGRSFYFVGVQGANLANGLNSCGTNWTDSERTANFQNIASTAKVKVIRLAWAQWYAPTTNGVTDWTALDRTVNLAKQNGLLLMPHLEDHWQHCFGTFSPLTLAWYQSGYQSPYNGLALSYQEWVTRVVTRYKDEPTIFAWELMNEADIRNADNSLNLTTALQFFGDVSALVKCIDPNHLVVPGMHDMWESTDPNRAFKQIHELPHLDAADLHTYAEPENPWPGSGYSVTVPVDTKLYTQDNAWAWSEFQNAQGISRQWTDKTGTIPAGTTPFQRAGLHCNGYTGAYTGDIYIETVTVGGTTWDFKSVTDVQGFVSEGRITLSNVVAPAHLGLPANSRVLKATFAPYSGNDAGSISVPPQHASIQPGATMTWRVWHDMEGDIATINNLAARADTMNTIVNKPLIIGEVGIRVEAGRDRPTRAAQLEAKLAAGLDNNVNSFVWTWDKLAADQFAVNVDDPDVMAAMARQADAATAKIGS